MGQATLLTFDDGGKSAMSIASYLEKNNLLGHFFITTSLIGEKYFLNKKEIIKLHERGHIIGSHSHSHPHVFKSLSYQEMIDEWSLSKEIIEKIIQSEVLSCSIPGGDANFDTYKSAVFCGYKYIFNSEPTMSLRALNSTVILGRICPKKGSKYKEIENLSKGHGFLKFQIIRQIKQLIKTILLCIKI